MIGYDVFSQYYDALTFNVDYSARAEYIQKIFAGLNHNMGLSLDLACGTGSLTCELKKRGVDIYGIDASVDMLSIANEKAHEQNLDILFIKQNMQSIDLFGTIDTCICTLDSINHLTDIKDVKKTFKNLSVFMNPGAYFLFDVNTVFKHRNILADNTFVYDVGEVFCVWQNSLEKNNVVAIDLDFFVREKNIYHRFSESFKERAYYTDELKEVLNESGFEVVKIYDDMTFDDAKEDSERLVFVARKI